MKKSTQNSVCLKSKANRSVAAQKGFTLVELMIAMSVAFMVIVLGYQSLSVAINSGEGTQEALDELDSLTRFWSVLDLDIQQVIERPSSLYGVTDPTGFGSEMDGDYLLKFNRAGRPNPAGQARSSLLRVGYRLDDGVLYRDVWPESEEPVKDSAQSASLYSGVNDLQFRFLSPKANSVSSGPWLQTWPGQQFLGQLPAALEVTLELEGYGKIRRLYDIKG